MNIADNQEHGTEEMCVDGDEHTPDPHTITVAEGTLWIVDICCAKCGRSGSVAIDPVDVQW